MSKLVIFVSATIVLILSPPAAQASPQRSTTLESNEDKDGATTSEPEEPIDENLSIVEPPPLSGKPNGFLPRYYPYRQQLTFRAGQTSGLNKTHFEDLVLGFQYLFPKFLSPKLEAGADLHVDGEGHLHAGLRWIANERGMFRPSYKISIDHLAVAEDRLATLTRIDNYYLRFSGTLEYVFWNPISIRLEPEVIANLKDSQLIVTLGLSRGW